jgi:hypothetical protein
MRNAHTQVDATEASHSRFLQTLIFASTVVCSTVLILDGWMELLDEWIPDNGHQSVNIDR